MYGRRLEQHEKSMGSYEVFAARDAMSIAFSIHEQFGYSTARRTYESFSRDEIETYEEQHQEFLAEFIQKSESQREPYLRRIGKDVDDPTRILFLTLAIIGVLRARDVMELRDRFRSVLAPGRGNRVTTAAVYVFTSEILNVFDYAWPDEPFNAIGILGDEEEEDDEDDDDDTSL